MANDHAPSRIKPADLRVECQKCGGDGRSWMMEPVVLFGGAVVSETRRYVGPCRACDGAGRIRPRTPIK